jgi:hypothetical protein
MPKIHAKLQSWQQGGSKELYLAWDAVGVSLRILLGRFRSVQISVWSVQINHLFASERARHSLYGGTVETNIDTVLL